MGKELMDIIRDIRSGDSTRYSKADMKESVRLALVEANGGSTTLPTYKERRAGKGAEVYTLLEEIIGAASTDGLTQNEFFLNLCDFRNVPLGDSPTFYIENSDVFEVSETGAGSWGIRRQRIGDYTPVSIPVKAYSVRFYDEGLRLMAGRSDIVNFMDKVSKSFEQEILNATYSAWLNAADSDFGGDTYSKGGSYDEDTMLDLIAHVEASGNGSKAVILGTMKGLRYLAPQLQGHDSKNSLYNVGYYERFYGSPVVCIPQRHKFGTTDFVYPDNLLTVIATDDKPIKVVKAGDGVIIPRDMTVTRDMTEEYLYTDFYGIGIAAAANRGISRYYIS